MEIYGVFETSLTFMAQVPHLINLFKTELSRSILRDYP